MSRTTKYKLLYVAALAMLGGLLIWLCASYSRGPVLFAIVLMLLVPGRLQGMYWRDFFRGSRLFAQRRFAESLPYFEQFQWKVNERPRLKAAVWLGWAIYSRDIEAMTLNNIGAVHLELGDLEQAAQSFKAALALDEQYPIPYYNLAVIAEINKDRADAIRLLQEAERLGYRRTSVDQLVHRAGELLARVEGRSIPGDRL